MIALRQSILNDYETCPYLCKVKYGETGCFGKADEEEITNKYATIGIIFHETMEHWGINKMKDILVPLDELHKMIDDKINVVDVSLFTDTEEIEKYRISLHEQLDWTWINACLTDVKPIGVEVNFQLGGLIPECIDFKGTIDRISGNLATKQVRLEDYKTGKTYTKKELSDNMQATIYSLAFYHMFGFLPTEFVFYFSKTKKIKTIYITPEFIKNGTNRILSIWYKMRENKFEPDNSNRYFCKNFCSEYKECPKFKKRNNAWDNVD